MTSLMLKNYKRLAYIDTGQYDVDYYRSYAHKNADDFGLRYEEIDGSPALVNKMVFGPWNDEFVVMEPGQTVQYVDFANVKP
jgi:hypothetical protein